MEKDTLSIFLEACIEDLEQYILSPVLYWRLSLTQKGPDGDLLTPGLLSLAVRKFLFLQGVTPGNKQPVDYLDRMDAIINSHPAVWSKKVAREIGERCRLWSKSIQELLSDPADHWASYPTTAKWRVMCDLLSIYKPRLPEQVLQEIQDTDRLLKSKTEPGCFVLDPDLKKAYSSEDFWYLYIQVPKKGG